MTIAGLTPKQERFVEEYLVDLNATQAAVRAGYSAKTAEQQGHQLLKKTSVLEAIVEAMGERSARTQVTQDEVVRELVRIAFSDMRAFLDFGPGGVTLKEISELPEDAARCITEVSESKTQHGSNVRFKLHSKMAALDALTKHLAQSDLDARLRAIEERLGLA